MRNRILVVGGLFVVLLMVATSAGCGDSRVGATIAALSIPAELDLEAESNTGQRLDDARRNLLQRTAIKRFLVAEFTAGRISLADAADGFLIVDQGSSQALPDLRRLFAGRTDRERAARSVIAWVRCGEPLQPGLTAHLDAEFRSLFPAE